MNLLFLSLRKFDRICFSRSKEQFYHGSMILITTWNVSKYRVISGPYFPVFGLNAGKYGPEVTPYLHTFHAFLTENRRKIFHKHMWEVYSFKVRREITKVTKNDFLGNMDTFQKPLSTFQNWCYWYDFLFWSFLPG